MKKRAVIIVIDSMGIGAMPDCVEFGDTDKCNTLKNVCEFNNGLNVPVLEAMGIGNIQNFKGINKTSTPIAQYGTLQEKSKGKDTTTGHWEIYDKDGGYSWKIVDGYSVGKKLKGEFKYKILSCCNGKLKTENR